MSKQHHQNREEKSNNKRNDNKSLGAMRPRDAGSRNSVSKDTPPEADVSDHSIQVRAYHLFNERGGSALDNWLEAERSLKNSNSAVAEYINEGNPND